MCWSAHHKNIISKGHIVLGLIRRTFRAAIPTPAKKSQYPTLVMSHFSYCSVLWRPSLLQDIKRLESVQRCTTKYIVNDYSCDYKTRLEKLNILPLMMYMYLELNDIIFYLKSRTSLCPSFDITKFISPIVSNTRSNADKLKHVYNPSTSSKHFYFHQLPRLWNALPVIDTYQPLNMIKRKLKFFLSSHFINNFNATDPCTFHFLCPCYKCSATPQPRVLFHFKMPAQASTPSELPHQLSHTSVLYHIKPVM